MSESVTSQPSSPRGPSGLSPLKSTRWRPPWAYIATGGLLIVLTYVYLVITKPGTLHGGGTGPAALVTLAGYLAGALLIISGTMKRLGTSTVALLPIGIAINIVVGQLNNVVGLPLYLDSIGTILVGVLAGPAAGAATGALANVIWGMTISPTLLPFSVAAAVIGFLAGVFARIGGFRRVWTAPIAGLVTGIFAAIVSAPISAFVYGNAGANAGRAAISAAFQAYGSSLLSAATLQGFLSDPLDKTVTFTIVLLILAALPIRFRQRFPFARRYTVFGKMTRAVMPTSNTGSSMPGDNSLTSGSAKSIANPHSADVASDETPTAEDDVGNSGAERQEK